ncbi:MAG TPA: cytochrome C [Leeuwenhoekiella sp.]|nr:cytochrome C [Leeuwenhoekiella sp.]
MIWVKRFLILLLIALIGIQFIRPERNEDSYESLEPFLAETKPSEQVAAILKTACYDCHSNQTQYPWYAEVAPVSFWLSDHIQEGKHHLNFSAWQGYSAKRKDDKLDELIEEVTDGEMPLESYTLIHQDAHLTRAQTDAMITWAKTARIIYSLKADLPQ